MSPAVSTRNVTPMSLTWVFTQPPRVARSRRSTPAHRRFQGSGALRSQSARSVGSLAASMKLESTAVSTNSARSGSMERTEDAA